MLLTPCAGASGTRKGFWGVDPAGSRRPLYCPWRTRNCARTWTHSFGSNKKMFLFRDGSYSSQKVDPISPKIAIQESQSPSRPVKLSAPFGNLHLYHVQDPQIVCEAVEREPLPQGLKGTCWGHWRGRVWSFLCVRWEMLEHVCEDGLRVAFLGGCRDLYTFPSKSLTTDDFCSEKFPSSN